MLKATGASIILITSEPCEPQVAVCSDICLPCHVENNGIKNTYLAPITLMDYLCNALGQAEAADDRLDRIEALLQSAEVLGS